MTETPGPRRDPRDGASSRLPPFIDSHAHLAGDGFTDDVGAVIQRLRDAGGLGVICIGESLEAAAAARRLSDAQKDVWWTAGVHPHDAASYDPLRDGAGIRDAMTRGAVAVGECGLDYHYDHSPRPLQRRAFADQLAIAREHRRPVVVHTREAEDDTMAMVREAGDAGIAGVLHCYTGSHALAEVGLAAGWYISFSGIITFKRWDDLALLRLVPEDRLLIESDSPYLAPVPNRSKRNEPAWCAYTLRRLAEVREAELQVFAESLVRNTQRVFALG
ncbi:MAG: TatD family hydrolase [Gemmatimonadaceae bacterium]